MSYNAVDFRLTRRRSYLDPEIGQARGYVSTIVLSYHTYHTGKGHIWTEMVKQRYGKRHIWTQRWLTGLSSIVLCPYHRKGHILDSDNKQRDSTIVLSYTYHTGKGHIWTVMAMQNSTGAVSYPMRKDHIWTEMAKQQQYYSAVSYHAGKGQYLDRGNPSYEELQYYSAVSYHIGKGHIWIEVVKQGY
ncbi:hypothetical protein RRG08_018617 [Elysia crispata]|uniref:Uncharacterized protein n=1 Tax=Elysia crispata TaxID=231223 RepID=A0AAE1ATA0_9GAST|nr:hypothetical protein RRG08_018617 [Elysia crispata]